MSKVVLNECRPLMGRTYNLGILSSSRLGLRIETEFHKILWVVEKILVSQFMQKSVKTLIRHHFLNIFDSVGNCLFPI